ncbi:malate:quinone oxidoreductase [Flavobacterium sp. NRK F10]|uniref:malate:quinone oxidoreductase n=1 Tax=Flavobacterium sp. NRK F10 TaxID=2954931 RepID=UPI00209067AD|nr:malate:quinone oxidoreductase [Flavobacterium sp. NRK F10]MCO6173794.1 malate:quinone oxidoreductase [Flavobacterium sp. NRK F10]
MNIDADVVLVGSGIMSATLGTFLKELDPNTTIEIFEKLDTASIESSDAWNNAGTGHSAFCELNYTPEKSDGSVDISKAVKIAEQFEVSRQFWAYLVKKNLVASPENFIRTTPHVSFVWGEDNVNFLKKRHEKLTENNLFKGMKFSTAADEIKSWIPLVMEGRKEDEKIAATYMDRGTDVNFGNLTRALFEYLKAQSGVKMHLKHEVLNLDKTKEGTWTVEVKDLNSGKKRKVTAKFVFLGAGGGALPLLEKSNIEEGKGFGGFPVSGQWLRCTNPEVIEKHHAKVYGKAAVGAPPMSVPHLDTRMIDGKQELLFGPYAGFTTKFLKNGSYSDLFKSIRTSNISPMLGAGMKNIPLTKYLIGQVTQSQEDRVEALREYFPKADGKDWMLQEAGVRVQIIKKDTNGKGILQFGTEIVSAADCSIAALLGASPGASTTVSIMLELLDRCFAEKMKTEEWQTKIKEMIPSYGQSLNNSTELFEKVRSMTSEILKLEA